MIVQKMIQPNDMYFHPKHTHTLSSFWPSQPTLEQVGTEDLHQSGEPLKSRKGVIRLMSKDIRQKRKASSCMATCLCAKRSRRGGHLNDIKWPNLVVTDVAWCNDSLFLDTFHTLEQRGVVLQAKVDAFDFMHCLAGNADISQHARQHGFDIIVMCGVSFGTFGPDGLLCTDSGVAVEQYRHQDRLNRQPQTKAFHEAVLGQDPYATIVNIHADNHQRYFLTAASNTYLRLGLFNPSGMRMVMGWKNMPSRRPLVSTITSHSLRDMSQFITVNRSSEEQLDLNRLFIDTLSTGGHVLVLGAGRLDICRDLLHAADSEKYLANASNGLHRVTSLTAPGRRAKEIQGKVVTYMDHCRHNDTVCFEKVMEWTMAQHPIWAASAT